MAAVSAALAALASTLGSTALFSFFNSGSKSDSQLISKIGELTSLAESKGLKYVRKLDQALADLANQYYSIQDGKSTVTAEAINKYRSSLKHKIKQTSNLRDEVEGLATQLSNASYLAQTQADRATNQGVISRILNPSTYKGFKGKAKEASTLATNIANQIEQKVMEVKD